MKKTFVLLLLLVLICSSCALKKKTQPKATINPPNPVLVVRHWSFSPTSPIKAQEMLQKLGVSDGITTVSNFPADVALAIVPGEFIPTVSNIGKIDLILSAKGIMKDGLVVPLEKIEWKKDVNRKKTTPKRDEKGSGISLRFEAGKNDEQINLTSSLWYSAINGPVWASETNGLIASEPNIPKVLSLLTTEMRESETSLFAVSQQNKKTYAVIAVSLTLADPKDDTAIEKKENVKVVK